MTGWQTYSERYPMLTAALAHAKRSDRMSHAYLVVTSNPDFRTDFPLLLAALRVCENQRPDGGPCMECGECRQILNGIYPGADFPCAGNRGRQGFGRSGHSALV